MSTIARLLFTLFALSPGFYATSAPAFDWIEDSRSAIDPVFGTVTYRILSWDQVFFDKRQQAIATDAAGHLLAATPVISGPLSIRCNTPAPQRCTFYDQFKGVIFEPIVGEWTPGQRIFNEDRPTDSTNPFESKGFRTRIPSLAERLDLEGTLMAERPLKLLLLIVWWTLAWIVIARIGWKWARKHSKITSVRVPSALSVATHLMVFTFMAIIVAFGWLLEPYSAIYGLSVCLSGALSAFLLMLAGKRTRPDAFQ